MDLVVAEAKGTLHLELSCEPQPCLYLPNFNFFVWFLQNAFDVIFTTVVDGSQDGQIGNHDALEIVGRMAVSSTRLDVRKHAINCLQDLVTLNPLNAVAVYHFGIVDLLLKTLSAAVQSPGNQQAVARALGVAFSPSLVPDDGFYAPPTTDCRARFAETLPAAENDSIINASPVYLYLASVARLLDYVAVILSEHNVYVLLVSSSSSCGGM
ncbi:hypothetical protein BC938DRAFT_476600 [Jimgerdemannia flammicorona]|nr:hypothetical protein BC938DRAFT_476600 [Jimgerdemannia flammicorona]